MKIDVEIEKLIPKLGAIGLSENMVFTMLLRSATELPICMQKTKPEKCLADILLWILVYSKIKGYDVEYYVNKLIKDLLEKIV